MTTCRGAKYVVGCLETQDGGTEGQQGSFIRSNRRLVFADNRKDGIPLRRLISTTTTFHLYRLHTMGLKSALAHTFPPQPEFTEENIPALDGKVYLVTGSNTGIGKEVARLLYTKNAKVVPAFCSTVP